MNFQFYNFTIFKRIISCLVFFVGFLLWGNAMAANIHICDIAVCGQTPGDGSTWSNALDDLPASLTRGDTYYIADGNYEGYLFDSTSAPTDGTKIITIKKATVSEHGDETGWDNTYGDGQAVFQWSDAGSTNFGYKLNTFRILVSYITIDGAIGTGSNSDNYGFKLMMAPCFGGTAEGCADLDQWAGITVGAVGNSDLNLFDIVFKHIAMVGPAATKDYSCFNDDDCKCSNTGLDVYLLSTGSLTNLTIEDVLSTHWNNNISVRLTTNLTIANNYVSDNWSSDIGDHGQNLNVDGITSGVIKNNRIIRSKTFAIAIHRNANPDYTGTNGLKIYNNLFYGTNPSMSGFISTMGNQTNGITGGLQVHHNTVVNQNCGGKGFVGVTTITNPEVISYVYNNLFYDTENCQLDNSGYTQNVIVHDYNAYLASTNYMAETHAQVDTDALATDIFTDYANGDYSLKIGALPINNGKTDLGATYALDYAGTERGASPDIGAYEYTGTSDTVAPASPTGLSIS